jgi:hypothetical protein
MTFRSGNNFRRHKKSNNKLFKETALSADIDNHTLQEEPRGFPLYEELLFLKNNCILNKEEEA